MNRFSTRVVSLVLILGAQAEYPLPYWPGVVVFHAIYAIFEVKRFENFQKYGEVRPARLGSFLTI
jgi:hypothetical protein